MKKDPTLSVPSKMSPAAPNMKKHPTPLVPPKTSPGAQNMKKDLTPSVPPKMSLGAQNVKTGPDALGTAENESWSGKHEIATRRPRYRRKRVRERKT
jgi:hypothetical protein